MSTPKALIAIPARGGSKRLPRKNILPLSGKPMIAYTIEAAVQAGISDDVYVCTEDEEIAAIAQNYGAMIHRIPKEMAGDEVSSTTPCIDLYKKLTQKGATFEYLFNLQPTSPLRNANDIKASFKKIIEEDADFLVSTTFIDPHYFHWGLIKKEIWWQMYFEKKYLKERTQLPPVYRPNGAIKLGKIDALLKDGNFFGERLTTHEMPEERSIHVATDFDLACVEGLIIHHKKQRNEPAGR